LTANAVPEFERDLIQIMMNERSFMQPFHITVM